MLFLPETIVLDCGVFMNKKHLGVAILLAIGIVTAFQNCSAFKFDGHFSQEHKSGPRQNGDSYSGKAYHHLVTTDICPDHSLYDATILASAGAEYFLTRSK